MTRCQVYFKKSEEKSTGSPAATARDRFNQWSLVQGLHQRGDIRDF